MNQNVTSYDNQTVKKFTNISNERQKDDFKKQKFFLNNDVKAKLGSFLSLEYKNHFENKETEAHFYLFLTFYTISAFIALNS